MQMQISIALLNARLHQSLHDAKERNESLVRVSLVINSELDLHNLLQKVMKEARELLGADRCSMYVCDHAKGELPSTALPAAPMTLPVSSLGMNIAQS